MFNYNTPSPSYQKPSTTLLVIRQQHNTPHVSKMASFLQHFDLLPETSQKATAKYDDSTSRE
ncbi:hypothetical protein ACMYSQ_011654 [Aspergillus niger]